MAGALVGAVSCARCAAPIERATSQYCIACGVLLVPAAPGGIVGSYSGMLGGVFPARAARRTVSTAIDAAPLVIGLIVAVSLSGTGPGPLLVFASAAIAYLLLHVIALSAFGRSLGRIILGLRTVDDLTGDPVSVGRFLRQVGSRQWGRRTMTAELRRGRDPLEPARQPIPAEALSVDHEAGPKRGRSARMATTAIATDTVTVVLDTGERYDLRDRVIIGRAPEHTPGEDAQLLPWPDLPRTLSKTHALLEWSGTVLWVTDLQSKNGSVLVSPEGERQPLAPGLRGAATVGWTVELGHRSFELRPGGGAPLLGREGGDHGQRP